MSQKSVCQAGHELLLLVVPCPVPAAPPASPPALDASAQARVTGRIGVQTSWSSGTICFTVTNVGGIACDADILLVRVAV